MIEEDIYNAISQGNDSYVYDNWSQVQNLAYASETSGSSFIFSAVRAGNHDMVRFLCEHGCEVDATNKIDLTPLSMASMQGNVEIVKTLLSYGADPSLLCSYGKYFALSIAVQYDRGTVVKELLENKFKAADPNQSNKNGLTALMVAVEFSYSDSVKMLLHAGADPTMSNKMGFPVLCHNARWSDRAIATEMVNDCVKAAKLKGVDDLVNFGLDQKTRPLVSAARASKIIPLQVLLSCGADVNIKANKSETTALIEASHPSRFNPDMVNFLGFLFWG